MKKLDDKTIGKIFLGLGALFTLSGLILFILSNISNLYTKAAVATITSKYTVDSVSGDKITILNITYKVGDKLVSSVYEYPGIIDDDIINLDIHYNIKDPEMIVESGWTFLPLGVIFLGLIILAFGLYMTNIYTFGLRKINSQTELEQMNDFSKKLYFAREKVENNLLPEIGSCLLTGFGILLVAIGYSKWFWIFIIVGAMAMIYFALDLIPAISEYRRLKSLSKFKVTVVKNDLDDYLSDNAEDKNENDVK